MYLYEVIISKTSDDEYRASIPDIKDIEITAAGEEEVLDNTANALRKTLQKYLLEGTSLPTTSFGHQPAENEHIVTLAIEVTLDKTEWFTVEESMSILNVTQPRISHLLRSGRLTAYREGRRTYILKDSLQAYLATPRHAGRPKKATS